MEPTQKEIREYVRQALCRLIRDALEYNDIQKEDPEVIKQTEDDILEDAELLFDYLRITR